MKRKTAKATDCGHGRVLNPCAIRVDAFIGCQACARMVMLGGGGIIMAAVPFEAIPLPGETITLHRTEIGDGMFTFVYRAAPPTGTAAGNAGETTTKESKPC